MQRKQRLWMVSEVFFPEEVATGYIMTEIALALSGQMEVHVICGPESYERKQNKVDYSSVKNLSIHRINKFNFNKNKLHTRLIRFIGIALSMFFKGLWHIKKKDKVFIVTNPAPLIPLYALLKWLKGFELIILVHDVFPENMVTGKMIKASNPVYKLLKRIFDKSYKKADILAVLGRDMQDIMAQKTNLPLTQIPIVPNWADLEHVSEQPFETNPVINTHSLKNKIVIQYAGNHGRLQHLPEFLQVVSQIDNPLLHFVFVGNGAVKEQMQTFAKDRHLTNVSFWDPFSRPEQNIFLNACHIGLVTLSDELYGLGVPSKSYNILASGKPILFLGNKDTEIARTIIENNCGWVFAHHQQKETVAFLNTLTTASLDDIKQKGRTGKALAINSYAKPIILEQFEKILSTEPRQ